MTSHRKPKKPPEPVEADIQPALFDVSPYRVEPAPEPTPSASDSWLTTAQLAERLCVRIRFVAEQAAGHRWPAHMVGREWRFSPEDLALIDAILRRPR